MIIPPRALALFALWFTWFSALPAVGDRLAELQATAAHQRRADWGHWGPDEQSYVSWSTHSNRLVPIYTYGLSLDMVRGEQSVYRDTERLKALYGFVPERTVNPQADYFDQTDVYRLQQQAVAAGKKRIILIVFDGMDWQTTQAAAIARSGRVAYRQGRGTGLHLQDYRGVATDYGAFVAAPHNAGTRTNVNTQRVENVGDFRGGYDWQSAGSFPWSNHSDPLYPIGKGDTVRHAYPDSAATATAMTAGVKTYNASINMDPLGRPVAPLGQTLQKQGFAVGVVTNVPISHATPACAYANNVHRSDYQDISRDLLGLPSVAHPQPLAGLDLLLGCGWGETRPKDSGQGQNFVPGNRYLAEEDLKRLDATHGGKYLVVQRTAGVDGSAALSEAAQSAQQTKSRLFGFFGVRGGHLPFRTANGDFAPVREGKPNTASSERYSPADLQENPTLPEMAQAALDTLANRSDRFWLLIEAGDVDWANHQNNLDNAVGGVLSGDDAFQVVTQWIEKRNAWDETAVILTADHGHYLVLKRPEALVAP